MTTRWTDEKSDRLQEGWLSNRPLREVAAELGVTFTAAQRRIERMRLPRRGPARISFWTAERDARLRELRAAGKSIDAISEAFDRPRSTINDRIRKLKLPLPPKPEPPPKPPKLPHKSTNRKGPRTLYLPGDGDWRKSKADRRGKKFKRPGFPDGVRFKIKREEPTTGPETREPKGCRWIHGDVKSGNWHYCQCDLLPGTSWCEAHWKRMWKRRVPINESDRECSRPA